MLPALPERGWRAIVAAPDSGPLLALVAQAGAEPLPLALGDYSSNRKPMGEWPRFVKESILVQEVIERIIAAFRPDLIYVNGPRVLPAAAFAGARTRTRCS